MASTKAAVLIVASGWALGAHDPITTKLTWTAEVSRIVYRRCAGCHRKGGGAPMALLDYEEARPWAKAIKEEILERRMPPWGAAKGFADLACDPSLTQEEIHLLADWVERGAPEGDPKYLPEKPKAKEPDKVAARGPVVKDGYVLAAARMVWAVQPEGLPKGGSLQVVAELPNGDRVPLLWMMNFQPKFARGFLYREPLRLPKGTRVRIIGQGAVGLAGL